MNCIMWKVSKREPHRSSEEIPIDLLKYHYRVLVGIGIVLTHSTTYLLLDRAPLSGAEYSAMSIPSGGSYPLNLQQAPCTHH